MYVRASVCLILSSSFYEIHQVIAVMLYALLLPVDLCPGAEDLFGGLEKS
jgi:hypothetical protein